MKVLAALLFLTSMLLGQDTVPVETTLCELWKNPADFAGKFVRLRTDLHYGRGRPLMKEGDCGPIPLAYPSDSDIEPKAAFELLRNQTFLTLESALPKLLPDTQSGKRGFIQATLEGRFDSVYKREADKIVRTGEGYGHLALYDNRLVLRNVEDVRVVEANGGK